MFSAILLHSVNWCFFVQLHRGVQCDLWEAQGGYKLMRINRCTVDVLEFDFEKKSGDASDYSECLALPGRKWPVDGGPNDVFHGQEQMEHLGLDPTDPLPPQESMEDLVGFQWDRGGFIHQDQSNASKKAIAAMSEDAGDMLHGTLSSHLVALVACSHCSLFQQAERSWYPDRVFGPYIILHPHIFAENSP